MYLCEIPLSYWEKPWSAWRRITSLPEHEESINLTHKPRLILGLIETTWRVSYFIAAVLKFGQLCASVFLMWFRWYGRWGVWVRNLFDECLCCVVLTSLHIRLSYVELAITFSSLFCIGPVLFVNYTIRSCSKRGEGQGGLSSGSHV